MSDQKPAPGPAAPAKLTKEEFVAIWSKQSLDNLREAARELGHELRATRKSDAVDEAWDLYSGAIKAQLAPVVVAPIAPVGGAWEVRCIGPVRHGYSRAGVALSRHWERKSPTPAQLAALQADRFVQIREVK